MTTYEDLTPYAYSPEVTGPVVNVGWLGPESRFEVGEPEPGFAEALSALVRFHRVRVTRGWHPCRLCGPGAAYPVSEPDGDEEVTLGSAEIDVPGTGVVYAAPNLVHHYVVRHHYRPPAVFVRAVLARAEASAGAWEETKRSLSVGTPLRGEIHSYHVTGLWFDLPDHPDVDAFVPNDLYGPDGVGENREHVAFHVPVDAVVVGHSDRERRVLLRV
ncbi:MULTISPECIES: DUF7919 family protein [Saccharothrix]|uniref:DUF7919 family protein n=1 Tax=Saccharothrix TaxID=2071 RepID=UPI00093C1278|nr:hypothetical protein [Saccharothrix sp. CB00851]OKI23925.1 hypothetical protein A6A25_34665 [Saccharothrix sp. CB00851]